MNLLPNEQEIESTAGKRVTLTNFRVIREEIRYSHDYQLSIFLEDISSLELHYKSNIWALILGILSVLIALYNMLSYHAKIESKLGPLLFGIALILYWWYSRKFTISIKPNGGERLDCIFDAASERNISDFLHAIECAKLERVNFLADPAIRTSVIVPPVPTYREPIKKQDIPTRLQCPSCKNTVVENDVFCENCGYKLK